MKVSTEKIQSSQVVLSVEMEAAEMEKALEETYHRLVSKVSVPGFRKGKAPRAILERHLGRQAFLDETLEHLLPQAYSQALETAGIEAVAQSQIELVQSNPLIFKATVPVQPIVKLGNYREIRLEPEPAEVTEQQIESAMERLRHQQAVWSPVERTAQFGDLVTANIEGNTRGEPFLSRKDVIYEVVKDSLLPLPGFAENLEGMTKGEEKNFVLSFPADYKMKELAGKEYSFKVAITEIKEKKLPDLDDEFARSLGSDNLTSMRDKVATDLKTEAEAINRAKFEQEIVNTAVKLSEVDYPPVLVDKEVDRLLVREARNFKEGIKGLEDYLKRINRTVEEHREELRPVATQGLLQSLVLKKIAEDEKIEISAQEVDNERERMIAEVGEKTEEMRKLFDSPQARHSIEEFLLERKTLERLVQIASGSA